MKLEVGSQKSEVGGQVTWFLAIFLMIISFNACTEEKETLNTPDNYDYFPLEVGKYWVYEVDSIVFQNQTRRDSSKTWVKEQIVDYFIDNVGDTIYRIDQYERKNTNQPWEIKRVISLLRNENRAIRTENNISLIKMIFPLRQSSNWNSTLLIDPTILINAEGGDLEIFKHWESKVENIDQTFIDENKTYNETVTVFHAQKDLGVENRFAKEIYAKNIGLVHREWQILDCDSTISDCFASSWDKKAVKGFILSQRLIDYN